MLTTPLNLKTKDKSHPKQFQIQVIQEDSSIFRIITNTVRYNNHILASWLADGFYPLILIVCY